ncbi:Major capsid protein Gp5 [uncultured Caudovirales phage]|uniref:Major capsid protein Gp5 n=1 Tax=uncultured Caudovirales phage TaxID=2100421 RepID=A0A6J5PHV1_9CAUD|nr:Major capsid protein Gp5 [uncultured Caudovirales phage]
MSNVLATTSVVAKEAVAILENMLSFSSMVNRDWEDEFTQNMARGYAPGQTINIKRPPRYTYRDGRVAVPQSTVQSTIPLTLSQGGCDLQFTAGERTLSLDKLSEKISAAIATVANEIDRRGLEMSRLVTPNVIGTPGTPPSTQLAAMQAITGLNQRLDEMAAPRDRRRGLIMNPALNASMVTGFSGMFNSQSILDKQMRQGMMVDSLGLSYAMDQNVGVHTNGSQPVTSGTVNGAGQSGSVINVNTASITGTLTRGSKITFANVFAVNPQSRQSTGTLAQFTLTADVAASATSISISPALVPSGAFQNVTASPVNTAVVTVFGTANGSYSFNPAFHKDAFTLAMVPMWAPADGKGVVGVSQTEYKGFRLKVTEFYDGMGDTSIMRIDVLYGWASPYPELACGYGL